MRTPFVQWIIVFAVGAAALALLYSGLSSQIDGIALKVDESARQAAALSSRLDSIDARREEDMRAIVDEVSSSGQALENSLAALGQRIAGLDSRVGAAGMAAIKAPNSASTTPSGAAPGGAAPAGPPLALVNGVPISEADLDTAFQRLPLNIQAVGKERVRDTLLGQLIDNELLAQAARADGVDRAPAHARTLAQYRTLGLRRAYTDALYAREITEDVIRARYEELFGGGEEPAREVEVRHILVDTKEEAEAIIAELGQGADFATLARERSTGPSADRGGALGFITRDDVVPAFADVAFALAPGEISEQPVQTQFGWHVIKAESERTNARPTFADVRDQLARELQRQALRRQIAALRAAAEIERLDDAEAKPAK